MLVCGKSQWFNQWGRVVQFYIYLSTNLRILNVKDTTLHDCWGKSTFYKIGCMLYKMVKMSSTWTESKSNILLKVLIILLNDSKTLKGAIFCIMGTLTFDPWYSLQTTLLNAGLLLVME